MRPILLRILLVCGSAIPASAQQLKEITNSIGIRLVLIHAGSFGLADKLDVITKMAEDDRPDYIARKLEEYSDNFVSSVMKLKLSEKGVRQFEIQDPRQGPTSEERKVDLVHDLVLSIENRYTNIPDVDGTRTVHTYDGKTGKSFRYAKSGQQTQVDLISRLPYISLSIEPFIILTGVTNFDGCSNAKLVADVKEMEWGDRIFDGKLGDCVVLKRKEIRQNGCTDKRTMYFGVWDSKIVLLRDELESAEPMEGSRILTYRWSSDFEYGQKFGKLLPETWTKLIASEWTDLEGNAVHKPLIIRSTTNAITSCEFLDRFPEDIQKIATDPTATVIDRREQR